VDDLQVMLQVSSAKLVEELPEVEGWKFTGDCKVGRSGKVIVMIVKAAKHKCPRCWTYAAEVEGELCARCEHVPRTEFEETQAE